MLVYLDTHDYSKLSDAVHDFGHQELLPIFHELVALADAGTVRFCFSYVLVSELLQVAPESFKIAQRKAWVVERLCGGRAFPSPFWLFKAELKSLVPELGVAPEQVAVEISDVLEGGLWFHEELANATSLAAFDPFAAAPWYIRLVLRLMARWATEENAKAALKTSPLYRAAAGTPLEDRIVDYLMRRITGPELGRHLGKAFCFPTKLVAHPEIASPISGMNKSIQAFGQEMMAMVQRFQSDIDRAAGKIGSRPPEQLFEELSIDIAAKTWLNIVRRPGLISKPQELKAYVQRAEHDTNIRQLTFSRFFADLLVELLTQARSVPKNRRKPRPSDGGDFLHALYAPYCNVMRADASFAEFVKPVARRYGCRVVGKLSELPGTLKAMVG